MHFILEFQTDYCVTIVNKEKKAWRGYLNTTKREAKEKTRYMRNSYKKEDGWKVSVQKRTALKVNEWGKEWVSEFYYEPDEWKDKPISNPSTDFIRRGVRFVPFGL